VEYVKTIHPEGMTKKLICGFCGVRSHFANIICSNDGCKMKLDLAKVVYV